MDIGEEDRAVRDEKTLGILNKQASQTSLRFRRSRSGNGEKSGHRPNAILRALPLKTNDPGSEKQESLDLKANI